MKTIGEQQNFQTLFCELRLENERFAPRFSVVWDAALARPRSRIEFKLAFVTGVLLLVVSLFSLVLWLKGRPSNQQHGCANVNPAVSTTIGLAPRVLDLASNQNAPLRASYHFDSKRRAMKLAEVRRLKALALREAEIRNALAVSSWQSPTAMLMESPADDVLLSLPQLYRSVTQMNSFLPDTQ